MVLVRPRLTDYFDLPLAQEDVDFAIPYLEEDIPLGVDPFLLWKSPSHQDNSLHLSLVNSFNHLGFLMTKGKSDAAREILVRASECDFTRLGFSQTGQGRRIGKDTADRVLNLFKDIPQLRSTGFVHFEEIQLLTENISKDRVSDFSCTFLLSFLIDYTMQQCEEHGIPTEDIEVPSVYRITTNSFSENEKAKLPVSPNSKQSIVLVPKRWLRKVPWISFDGYIDSFYSQEIATEPDSSHDRIKVLNFNRNNYGMVQAYTQQRERTQEDCKNDPLFRPLPLLKVKQKIAQMHRLATGIGDKADKKYEELVAQLLSSMLYPQLDFADTQSRTDSGVLIRDLLFYNSRKLDFLQDIFEQYGSRQIVMEMKNVKEVQREHVNQLARYLAEHLGKFGVLVTRNELPRKVFRNTVDLWSGQRKCIIQITDQDVIQMGDVFESKQRMPIEVLQKRFVEFMRACPS